MTTPRNVASKAVRGSSGPPIGARNIDRTAPIGHASADRAQAPDWTEMLIYKIFRRPEWNALRDAGETLGAPIDLADGYIHFSTVAQVAETAEKHFATESDLVLVAVEAESLGDDLKWEPSRGGALFPHLYRELRLGDVFWDKSLPLGATGHIFPAGML